MKQNLIMEISQEVLTKSKKGKVEVRSLIKRGKFVVYEYLDPKTLQRSENKVKLVLKDEDGKIEEFFLIPLKESNKFLALKVEEKGERKIWNPKTKKVEELFYDES